jgi:hypothetical protein
MIAALAGPSDSRKAIMVVWRRHAAVVSRTGDEKAERWETRGDDCGRVFEQRKELEFDDVHDSCGGVAEDKTEDAEEDRDQWEQEDYNEYGLLARGGS